MSLSPILILTAAFGDGHNAAARGLAAALQLRGGHPVVADPFAESKPALNDFARRLYLSLINRAPHAWNLFYATCHRLPLIENTLFSMGQPNAGSKSCCESTGPGWSFLPSLCTPI